LIAQIAFGVWIVIPGGTLPWFYFCHMLYQGSLNIYIISRYVLIYNQMRSHRLKLVGKLNEVENQ